MASFTPNSVIIVGTGWNGLAAARIYLQINPSISLTILESSSSIGGVWSASRRYPGLTADSPVGLYEYSDMSMQKETGLKRWDDIPAEKVEQYLVRFAERHGLFKYIRRNTKVVHIKENCSGQLGQGWELLVQEKEMHHERLRCNKLILATGRFSTPRMPCLDLATFTGPVLHSKDVAKQHHALLSQKAIQNIIVIGGSKSAGEMVNLFVSNDKYVTWLIREGGNGPGFLLNPRNKSGVHYSKYGNRRWQGLMGPSIMRTEGFWYKFLHGGKSKVGAWTVQKYWDTVNRLGIGNVYDVPVGSDTKGNIEKIKPDIMDLFWTTGGTATYADNAAFMDRVRDGKFISVHRASIAQMREHSALLSNGSTVEADAVICCTGWSPTQSGLFAPELCSRLGLPLQDHLHPQETREWWRKLDEEADIFIRQKFPKLASPPHPSLASDPTRDNPQALSPFRLYRTLIPLPASANAQPEELHRRNILILGTFLNVCIPVWAEISSLWGIAYMEGLLNPPHIDNRMEMAREVARQNAWMRWRFRRVGVDATGCDSNVDAELGDFLDRLTMDLGLQMGRSGRWEVDGARRGLRFWWRKWIRAYEPRHWSGLVEEYLKLNARKPRRED